MTLKVPHPLNQDSTSAPLSFPSRCWVFPHPVQCWLVSLVQIWTLVSTARVSTKINRVSSPCEVVFSSVNLNLLLFKICRQLLLPCLVGFRSNFASLSVVGWFFGSSLWCCFSGPMELHLRFSADPVLNWLGTFASSLFRLGAYYASSGLTWWGSGSLGTHAALPFGALGLVV